MPIEHRNNQRKKFGYYMRVVDNNTSELVGYLSDISSRGLKLDCPKSVIVNKDYIFRMDLTPDVSDRPYIIYIARTKWCSHDPMDPSAYISGFEVVNISPHDEEIFNRIIAKYAAPDKNW